MKNLITIKALSIALVFGCISLVTSLAGVHIYLPGTPATTDPMEIFNSLGSALSGPVGAVIITVISTLLRSSSEYRLEIFFIHLISSLFISLAYKKVYENYKMPLLPVIWALLIVIYYLIANPTVFLYTYLFNPGSFDHIVGEHLPFYQAMIKLYRGWMPEIIFTTVYTSVVLIALPERFRKPQWGVLKQKERRDFSSKLTRLIYNKLFVRNYLAVRLSIWFVLLFSMTLIYLSIFNRNYFLGYYLEQRAEEEFRSAVILSSIINKTDGINEAEIISGLSSREDRIVVLLDANLNVCGGKNTSQGQLAAMMLPNNEQKIKVLRNKQGSYIDRSNNIAAGYSWIGAKEKYVFSISKTAPDFAELDNFVLFNLKNGFLTLLFVSSLSGILIWLIIGSPLKKMTSIAQKIGVQNYDASLNPAEMTDEIRILANAVNSMQVNIMNANQLLEENYQKYKHLYETANAAIMIMKGEIYTDCNEKTLELFGCKREEIIGRSPVDYSPIIQYDGVNSKTKAVDLIGKTLTGSPQSFEWLHRRNDGTYFDAEVSLNKIILKKEVLIQAIVRDITERKRTQAELIKSKEAAEEANKLKSSLLSNMSHEFRTPLNGILGFAEIMRSELEGSEYADILKKILRSARRLLNTLNSIITVTELENNKYYFKKAKIDLNHFCESIIKNYSSDAFEKNLTLSAELTEGNLMIESDEAILSKIIGYLLDNAIKYTSEGEIVIKTNLRLNESGINETVISVSDTGIGIKEEDQKIIFNEFVQVSKGYNRSFEGSGLGLALAQKMALLIGSEISVISKPGMGSVFSLVIPQDENQYNFERNYGIDLESILAVDSPKEKSELIKILLIEDNQINSDLVVRFLTGIAEVDTASDGDMALKLAEENKYELLLIDINLSKGLDGIEVLSEIMNNKQYKDVPSIAITGYSSSTSRNDFLDKGFTDYLSKPFEKEALLDILGKYYLIKN